MKYFFSKIKTYLKLFNNSLQHQTDLVTTRRTKTMTLNCKTSYLFSGFFNLNAFQELNFLKTTTQVFMVTKNLCFNTFQGST